MVDLSSTTIALGSGVVLGTVDANGTMWRIKQDGFTGWGEPASTLSPIQKPRQQGAWAGDSFNTPRGMTVSGTIRAKTPALLNLAIEQLLTAVTNAAFIMTVTESGTARWVTARKSGETLTPKVTNVLASFSIQVASLDSRKFGTALSGSTFLPSSSGGVTVPLAVPFSINSSVVSGQVTLNNPGNEIGTVRLRIDGPTVGPQITHLGSALPLVFASSLTLGVGEWLTVDMERHSAMANDQSSRNGYILSRGWSGFDPGPNTWAFTASGYNAASKLTVTAIPASK